MSFVYFILDEKSNAVKIGKANNINQRLQDLQTGNPNTLSVIYNIKCKSEEHSFLTEKYYHKKFEHIRVNGEWFTYDEKLFEKYFTEETNYKPKEKRSPLTINGLFGQVNLFGVKNSPSCHFYPNLTAQIMDNYENASKRTIPFRTMEFPTNGKQMLLPYSHEKDRVFISFKKHKENLEYKRFIKKQRIITIDDFL